MSMANDLAKQQAFVLRTLEERNIRFIRLWFTDVLGFLKSVAIAPAELENAFTEGIGFDGSAIEGFARITEADMLAKPDPASFSILPWRTESPGAARMFCDISLPDGTPASVDPRRVLRQTLEKVAKLGYTCYTHPEIEFFLFKDEPKPGQEPVPVDMYLPGCPPRPEMLMDANLKIHDQIQDMKLGKQSRISRKIPNLDDQIRSILLITHFMFCTISI